MHAVEYYSSNDTAYNIHELAKTIMPWEKNLKQKYTYYVILSIQNKQNLSLVKTNHKSGCLNVGEGWR